MVRFNEVMLRVVEYHNGDMKCGQAAQQGHTQLPDGDEKKLPDVPAVDDRYEGHDDAQADADGAQQEVKFAVVELLERPQGLSAVP